ncbi:MAG: hypothetical protein D3924_10695 [Candidatus Electrothrix sp. AR4]|nr:hypothetical protein [Candidatus Electrothrix sp. AR4]
MKTFREKITFALSAFAYLLFHFKLGPSTGSMIAGTVEQLLTTAPYCVGFTWILVAVIRFLHNGKWPPWDRIARIFFTLGILFGFYFALYEYNNHMRQESPRQEREETVENIFLLQQGQSTESVQC